MNYYGRVIEENFNGDFLKEALLQVDEELPFRGPLSVSYTHLDISVVVFVQGVVNVHLL